MDECAMTNEQLAAWRLIGADLGYEFDELGHPFRREWVRDRLELGEQYLAPRDWRPLENDGDSFALMCAYKVYPHIDTGMVYAWQRYGAALAGVPLEGDVHAAVREAIFLAAAHIVRENLRSLEARRSTNVSVDGHGSKI